ncbi:M23 family metallopeptidase [Pseudolysinimonas sp.]|uniref:M23 family metallopeptidase n=1 Tax=Pseudolysinimonas sp. TaxID=2680009 RepID=UPI003783B57E
MCLTALGTLTIPAAVAAIELAQVDASAQSFQLSTNWAKAAEVLEPERDEFDVTEFTLVQWPVGAGTSISSYFGYRSCEGCSSFHTGIDFTPGAGTPIEAVADGVVVSSPVADGSWGVHVTIEHDIDGSIYRTSYAHLQTGSMSLQMGDTVERGQVIGRVGSTGQSNGAHLHFTVQTADGAFINPLPWMTSHVNILD